MRTCRVCGGFCDDGAPCPSCEKQHQKKFMPVYGPGGKRKTPVSLDLQEGNDEEYWGGFSFPMNNTWGYGRK